MARHQASGLHASSEPTGHRRRARPRAERGATTVEYALIVVAIVVLSLGAISGLRDSSEAEVANEFDCVSERPPPPSCQKRAVSTTTSVTSPSTTTTIAPTTTTTAAPIVSSATWFDTNTRSEPSGQLWFARTRLVLKDPQGNVLHGVTVTVEVINASTGAVIGSYQCVTNNGNGHCVDAGGDNDNPWSVIPGDVGSVWFRAGSVQATPPVSVPSQTSSLVSKP